MRRRIFKPASKPRRWGSLAMAIGAAAGALALATALPRDLFGSAPVEPTWHARGAEVRVVDGETLRLGDRTLRLLGLAAPQRGQPCHDGTRVRDCGAAAAAALARLVADRDLECQPRGHDRQGRALGLCRAAGVELNAAQVAAGWALADAAALPALAALEAAARRQGLGLWAGGFEPPTDWRRP